MRQNLVMLLLLFSCLYSTAQQRSSIQGVVADRTKKSATINYATISVYNSLDSTLFKFKLSDQKGNFNISGLMADVKYNIVISAYQYYTFTKEITPNKTSAVINLDTVYLSLKDNLMEEVLIVSKHPPIIVKNDTIEFNADSFKTLPAAVIEDLLKKLPGVAVGRNGNISYNGRAVSKILVDGKDFFDGDLQVASKNLPANIVEKVQITEDNEARRKNPNLLLMDIPQVIDLKLKRAVKQGAFGKAYVGTNIKEHYEAGGILNVFRDTTQISLLAFRNNVNRSAFSVQDVKSIGGFDRGGYSSLRTTEGGGFSIDNISFGATGDGVQSSGGAGINFNTLVRKKVKLNSKYFFGTQKTSITQTIDEDQNLGDSILKSFTNINTFSRFFSHNLGAKLTFQPNAVTELIINPTITVNPRNIQKQQNRISQNESDYELNRALVNSERNGLNISYKLGLDLYKTFNKEKNLYLGINILKSSNEDKNLNYANSYFLRQDSTFIFDQYRNTDTRNKEVSLNTNYSMPLDEKFKLNSSLSANFFDNESALKTFFRNDATKEYDILQSSLSETVNQKGVKTSSSASITWMVNKDVSIQPSLFFNTINIRNSFDNFGDFAQNFYFINPGLNFRYKKFSIDYLRSFVEPPVQYIQPIANNLDPQIIQLGSPELVPSKKHRLYMNYRFYDVKKAINYSFNLIGNIQSDGIVMSRRITANSVQITKPINTNGIRNVTQGVQVSKSYTEKSTQISINVGYSLNLFQSPLIISQKIGKSSVININPSLGFNINLNDKVEIYENYSPSFSYANYSDEIFQNRNIATHVNDTELIIRMGGKIVLETSLNLQLNNQNIAGYNNSINMWNAGCTYVFLKNNNAQLKLSINDILNTNVNRFVSVSENIVQDIQMNNIGRYGLITFIYNFRNYKGKVGGKERFLGI